VAYRDGGSALSFVPPAVPAGVTIRGYLYQFSCSSGKSWSQYSTSQTANPLILSGSCAQGTFNSFRIAARVDAGYSAWSAWRTVGPAIGAPTLSSVAYRDGGSALSFVRPSLPAGVTIRGYLYQFSCNGGNSWSQYSTSQTANPLILSGTCAQGTFNSFRIAARVDAGYSAWSAWRTISPTIGAPTLTGAKLFTGGATLTFVAPSVPSGTTIRGYLYRISCNGGLSWSQYSLTNFTGFSGTASATCSAPSIPWYQIAARVDAGYSSWSAWRAGSTV
jgi:hypothetical protein